LPTPRSAAPPRSFCIATFGCKVNQHDSQVMREMMLAAGYEERPLSAAPDFAVVNTCTVTGTADAKARRLVRRIAREAPACRIVVAGCMVDRDPDALRGLPNVWAILDNGNKPEIADMLTAGEGGVRLSGHANTFRAGAGISAFPGHTRAFVKVQDGCNAGCAYCIVPAVRGEPRSRPMSDVLDEARRLARHFKEIVLTGVHVGLYRDPSGAGLAELAQRILDTTSVDRLRLSSIEVGEVTSELLDLAATSPRVCPHFHIPLQSGSDPVLERMNRRYTAGQFLGTLDRVRRRLDRPSLTTDVIVGFPGEGEPDFAETVAVCRAAGFSRMHIFPYSSRPGTAAAQMPEQCPARVVAARKQALKATAAELALDYKRRFLGETLSVLVETSRDRTGKLGGYTDRYVRVRFDGPDKLRGRIVSVAVSKAEPGALLGTWAEEKP